MLALRAERHIILQAEETQVQLMLLAKQMLGLDHFPFGLKRNYIVESVFSGSMLGSAGGAQEKGLAGQALELGRRHGVHLAGMAILAELIVERVKLLDCAAPSAEVCMHFNFLLLP